MKCPNCNYRIADPKELLEYLQSRAALCTNKINTCLELLNLGEKKPGTAAVKTKLSKARNERSKWQSWIDLVLPLTSQKR
jgi:hypothetical protein